jgi:hypothetical protein
METVTILLNPTDAELFKRFQQHHAVFALMMENGAFDIAWGKATIMFQDGKVKSITKEEIVYHA